MKCKWSETDKDCPEGRRSMTCVRCGLSLCVPLATERIHATCRVPGWGDYLAHFLVTWFGVDKDRFTKWVRLIRPQATGCGCQPRQEVVNEVGWLFERLWRAIRMILRR